MKITDINLQRNSNNFDVIRIIAASFVLIGHSSAILLNKALELDPFQQLFGVSIHYFGVLIFFIISGFLVTRSWECKKNTLDFLKGRVLRIFPALICVIIVSVFLLGVLITTYDISDYLSSPITRKYMQSMTLFRIHYNLPGVFETNPIGSSINGSLWSLPYEFTCYLILVCLAILKFLKSKWHALFILISLAIFYLIFREKIDKIVIPILGIDFKTFMPLFLYFLNGSVYYYFIKLIPFNIKGLIICGIAIILIKINYFPELLLSFILPYLVLSFAFSKKIRINLLAQYGDFSYGLYLYAFPMQQLIVFLLPIKVGVTSMIFLSIVFTIPFAILSWKFIEKPALSLREYKLKFYNYKK